MTWNAMICGVGERGFSPCEKNQLKSLDPEFSRPYQNATTGWAESESFTDNLLNPVKGTHLSSPT